MTIFAVFRVKSPERLGPAIAERFPSDHYALGNNEWLVAADMTPQEVSDALGISDGSNGAAIVFSMRGYYGRSSSDIWDWIKTKAEGFDGKSSVFD